MAITRVQAAGSNSASATTLTATFASAVNAGDLLVCFTEGKSDTGNQSVSDNINGAWTNLTTYSNIPSSTKRYGFHYKIATASASAGSMVVTLTPTLSSAGSQFMQIMEYTNVGALDTIVTTNAAHASGTTATITSGAPSVTGDLVLMGFASDTQSNKTFTANSPMTAIVLDGASKTAGESNVALATMAVAEFIGATTSAVAGSMGIGVTDDGGKVIIGFLASSTRTSTQSAIARIANSKTKTQTAIARIANSKIKTQTATGRVAMTVIKTQSATGRIANSKTKTQTAIGRIANSKTTTQAAIGRIANSRNKTQSATANIQSAATITKTQGAISRIAISKTKTQTAIGRISNIINKTQSAIARLARTGSFTQSATARIGQTQTTTQSAKAAIGQTQTRTQSAKARIVATKYLTQSARARIQQNRFIQQSATARIIQTQYLLHTPVIDGPARGTDRFWRHFRPQKVGVSILKINGVYVAMSYPSQDQIALADAVYLGGHEHFVSQSEATALTAAGYTVEVIT